MPLTISRPPISLEQMNKKRNKVLEYLDYLRNDGWKTEIVMEEGDAPRPIFQYTTNTEEGSENSWFRSGTTTFKASYLDTDEKNIVAISVVPYKIQGEWVNIIVQPDDPYWWFFGNYTEVVYGTINMNTEETGYNKLELLDMVVNSLSEDEIEKLKINNPPPGYEDEGNNDRKEEIWGDTEKSRWRLDARKDLFFKWILPKLQNKYHRLDGVVGPQNHDSTLRKIQNYIIKGYVRFIVAEFPNSKFETQDNLNDKGILVSSMTIDDTIVKYGYAEEKIVLPEPRHKRQARVMSVKVKDEKRMIKKGDAFLYKKKYIMTIEEAKTKKEANEKYYIEKEGRKHISNSNYLGQQAAYGGLFVESLVGLSALMVKAMMPATVAIGAGGVAAIGLTAGIGAVLVLGGGVYALYQWKKKQNQIKNRKLGDRAPFNRIMGGGDESEKLKHLLGINQKEGETIMNMIKFQEIRSKCMGEKKEVCEELKKELMKVDIAKKPIYTFKDIINILIIITRNFSVHGDNGVEVLTRYFVPIQKYINTFLFAERGKGYFNLKDLNEDDKNFFSKTQNFLVYECIKKGQMNISGITSLFLNCKGVKKNTANCKASMMSTGFSRNFREKIKEQFRLVAQSLKENINQFGIVRDDDQEGGRKKRIKSLKKRRTTRKNKRKSKIKRKRKRKRKTKKRRKKRTRRRR